MEKRNDSPRGPHAKQVLLPQITRLKREGLSYREIAAKLGVSKSAVGKWLRDRRSQRAARKIGDPAEILRKKIARYRSIADTLPEAWRLSQADRQVRTVERSGPAGNLAAGKEKESVRTVPQTGNAAYLTKAMDAEARIEALEQRLAALEHTATACASTVAPILAKLSDADLEQLTLDDLHNFTDDELFIIESRLRAKYGRTEMPLLTNEELANMTDEQYTALEQQLRGD